MRRASPLLLVAALGVLFLLRCAHPSPADRVRLAREGADMILAAIAMHIESRVAHCAPLHPPRTPAMRECLGPVASDPDRAVAIADEVHRLQLAAYLAATGGDIDELDRVMSSLTATLDREFRRLPER